MIGSILLSVSRRGFAAAAVVVTLCVRLVAQSGGSSLPPRPDAIVDTPEFMTLVLKPAYVDLQRALVKAPATRPEWADVYQRAVRLAETANLLFVRHHAGADTPDWAARSAGARDAAADVVAAALFGLRSARAEDFDAVKQKFAAVAAACNACHRQFGGTNAPQIRDRPAGIRDQQ